MTIYKVLGSGKPIHYTIMYSFEWLSFPLLSVSGGDQIAIGWGGDLVANGYGSAFEYNNGQTAQATSVYEAPINAGVKFTFPQI